MNISQAIFKISENFKSLNIENYSLEAEMLLSFVLKRSREHLLAYGDEKISFFNKLKINSLIKKRIKGYSLAVLVVEKEFYGRKFYVNKDVLVPRPETETIVSEITNYELRITNEYKKINIIDVGTGSGCIVISLLKELTTLNPSLKRREIKELTTLNPSLKRREIKAIAIDISNKALKVAKKNAKAHDVSDDIEFIKSDLLEELIKKNTPLSPPSTRGEILIITANLPYLTPKQIKDSPTIKKEPRVALVAGDDGLLYYRRLFLQIVKVKQRTKNKEQRIVVLCEIDESQVNGIRKLIGEIIPDIAKVKIKKDLGGHDRLVVIEIN